MDLRDAFSSTSKLWTFGMIRLYAELFDLYSFDLTSDILATNCSNCFKSFVTRETINNF